MEKIDQISAAAAAAPPYGTLVAAGIQLFKKYDAGIKLIKGLFVDVPQWKAEDQLQTVIEEAKTTLLYGQDLATAIFTEIYGNIDKTNFANRRQVVTEYNSTNKVHEKLLQITADLYHSKILSGQWIVTADECGKPAASDGGQTERDQVTRYNVWLGYLCREKAAAYTTSLNGVSGQTAWLTKQNTYLIWFNKYGIIQIFENLYQTALQKGIFTAAAKTELQKVSSSATGSAGTDQPVGTDKGIGSDQSGAVEVGELTELQKKEQKAALGYLAAAAAGLLFFGRMKQ